MIVTLAAAAALVYGAGLTGYLLIRLVAPGWPGTGLLNSLMPLFALPTLIALPLMVAAREWMAAASLVPMVLLLLATYGPRFLPRGETAGDTLTLLTYNLASATSNPAPLLAVIESAEADVVVLQELLTPLAGELADQLRQRYPHQSLFPTPRFAVGTGIFSRYPVVSAAQIDGITLGTQWAIVETPRGPVRVYSAHPVPPRLAGGYDETLRSAEIATILADIAAEPASAPPTLLAGDFNMTEFSPDYARVRDAGFADAYAAAGFGLGPTFPDSSRNPNFARWVPQLIRIDYVFYDPGVWSAASAAVIGSGGSDHFAVRAVLNWRG